VAGRWDRFEGSICGFGTASGTRIVVGRWEVSPFGAFADVMVERPDGTRLLLAPTQEVGDYVGGIYGFDDVQVVPVTTSRTSVRLAVSAGPLEAEASIGRRTRWGRLLRLVPRRLATSPTWAGREMWASAPEASTASPVRFGFGSTPPDPSIVDVVTSVARGTKSRMADDLTASASAHVDASAEEVFAFIARPANHAEISGDGTVKGERQGAEVLSKEGDTFGMSMKMYGLPYRITNTVVEYEDGRRIAWCHPGKHRWRWEVTPDAAGGCTVTETFDMSTSPLKPVLKLMGYPAKHRSNVEQSVANVAAHFASKG